MININFDLFQNNQKESLTLSMFWNFDPPSTYFTKLSARIKDIQASYKTTIHYDTIEATVNDDTGKKVVLKDQYNVYCAILQHTMSYSDHSWVMEVHLKNLFEYDGDEQEQEEEEEYHDSNENKEEEQEQQHEEEGDGSGQSD